MRKIDITQFITMLPTLLLLALSVPLWNVICAASEGNHPPSIAPEELRLARKLVEALGDDSYLLRQKASESLIKLGRAAIEPLEDGMKSESSEIRLRSTELLIALRGRGLVGIGMLINSVDALPESGAGVRTVPQGLPAEQAGIQAGDVIVALNGAPVRDNNDLQHFVFVTGPARVMDVTIDRSGEKLHLPVLLTLNMNPPASSTSPPPISLESELAEADVKGRAEAREKALQSGFGQFNVVQGVVVQQTTTQQAQPAPMPTVNVQNIEAEFEKLKEDVKKTDEEPANALAK